MAEALEARVISIIQSTLRHASGNPDLALGPTDSMETVGEWDSLSFMEVFGAINDAFGINPDFDDAVEYVAVASLCRYLESVAC